MSVQSQLCITHTTSSISCRTSIEWHTRFEILLTSCTQ
jgi:hypothetical protein